MKKLSVQDTTLSAVISRSARTIRRLNEYANSTKLSALAAEARSRVTEIRTYQQIFDSITPRVALVAHTGTGKTSLANGIVAPDSETKAYHGSLLPTGPGGTTPCECIVRQGPAWEIRLHPATLSTVEEHFRQWARHLKQTRTRKPDGTMEGDVVPAPPTETVRLLRGFTGLAKPSRTRDGKRSPDLAIELAKSCSDVNTLYEELLSKANIQSRRKTQWFPEAMGSRESTAWVRNKLKNICKGLEHDAPYPKTLTIQVPHSIVELPSFFGEAMCEVGSFELLDTRGLRAISEREGGKAGENPLLGRGDLRKVLSQSWTATILVSGFMTPPNPITNVLQGMLDEKDTFFSALNRLSVVISDQGDSKKPGLDDGPESVIDDKLDTCTDALTRMQVPVPNERVAVIDIAHQAVELNALCRLALANLWQFHIEQLQSAVDDSEIFLDNVADAERAALIDQATSQLRISLNVSLPQFKRRIRGLEANIAAPLATLCSMQHWKALQAMAGGEGYGASIDIEGMFDTSFRATLRKLLNPLVKRLNSRCLEMLHDPKFSSITSEVRRGTIFLVRRLKSDLESVATRCLPVFVAAVTADGDLWLRLKQESGTGYVVRYSEHIRVWGEADSDERLQEVSLLSSFNLPKRGQ